MFNLNYSFNGMVILLLNCIFIYSIEMGVLAQISKRLEEQEWLLPTDVQSEAIPLILGGGDVLMAAETGSGKTGTMQLPPYCWCSC